MDATVAKAPWDLLVLDTLSSMPKSENGYRFILAIVDVASRWLELLPLRSKDPLELAFVLEQNVFLTFGPSSSVLVPSEKPEFESPFPKILKKYSVMHNSLEMAHPQLLTMVSRCLKRAKRALIQMKRDYPTVPWDHLLKHVSYKHRTRRHGNINSSPQKLVLPFKPVERTELMEEDMVDDEENVIATGAISIRAQRDHRMALEQERDWFHSNLKRFGGLSLSLKAEAMRSKMLLDRPALATFDGEPLKSPLAATAAVKKIKDPWSMDSAGGQPVK